MIKAKSINKWTIIAYSILQIKIGVKKYSFSIDFNQGRIEFIYILHIDEIPLVCCILYYSSRNSYF